MSRALSKRRQAELDADLARVMTGESRLATPRRAAQFEGSTIALPPSVEGMTILELPILMPMTIPVPVPVGPQFDFSPWLDRLGGGS